MNIVGGTYLELCHETGTFESPRVLLGSGLRAAAVLRSVIPELVLHTATDSQQADEAETVAATFALEVQWRERSEAVRFHYWTPLSAPTITGPSARASNASIDDGPTLVFGMIESGTSTDVEGLVFDPQQPRDLGPINLESLKCERLAIVANPAETRAMAEQQDLEVAAKALQATTGAEVVITKQGARGALVTTLGRQELVGAWPTSRVWPIGSGDVFAAGFAYAWLHAGAEPVEAARVGSYVASRWCERQSLDMTLGDFEPALGELSAQVGKVYLAAPFFSLGQRWLVELVRDSLLNLGGNVFSPLHDVGKSDDSAVARLDLQGLEQCTAVLALLDEADPGAMFEAGWAEHAKLPTVVFSEEPEGEQPKWCAELGPRSCRIYQVPFTEHSGRRWAQSHSDGGSAAVRRTRVDGARSVADATAYSHNRLRTNAGIWGDKGCRGRVPRARARTSRSARRLQQIGFGATRGEGSGCSRAECRVVAVPQPIARDTRGWLGRPERRDEYHGRVRDW